MRVDVDEELMDDMGGTPTPMNAANRAQQAYAAGRDKRKRKVRQPTAGGEGTVMLHANKQQQACTLGRGRALPGLQHRLAGHRAAWR